MREKQKRNMINYMTEITKTVKGQFHLIDSFIFPSEIIGNKKKS